MNDITDEFAVACPKCGAEQQDLDGFGVLYCPACRYCQHPSGTLIRGGGWVCNLCGHARDLTKLVNDVEGR